MNQYKNSAEIKDMFNKIAKDYDFLNNLISAFLHILIKRKSISLLKIKTSEKVLDLCCGSGDLARIVKELYPGAIVTGADFSSKMLDIAKKKGGDILYLKQDATKLFFNDMSYDYVVSGFGLRNIPDKDAAIKEIYRVLTPGSKFLHLDFGEKTLFSLIVDFFILFFARIFSKNFCAYKYLIESKREFLSPLELIKKVESHNFKLIKRKDFIFKTITCEVFEKQ